MSVNEPEADPPRLALLQGGKGTINWLGKLPKGTVFLTRQFNSQGFELVQFQVVEKSDENILLMVPNHAGLPSTFVWVDPIKFSSLMEQKEILALGKEENDTDDGVTPE